jgi:alpha-mannosidase
MFRLKKRSAYAEPAVFQAGGKSYSSPAGNVWAVFPIRRDAVILKIYNPCPGEKRCEVQFAFPLAAVWETDPNENRSAPLVPSGPRSFGFTCPSNRIMTFKIE